jgi:hypothetical protein
MLEMLIFRDGGSRLLNLEVVSYFTTSVMQKPHNGHLVMQKPHNGHLVSARKLDGFTG